MAIVKHIKSRNANYSAAINYLLFEHDEKPGKDCISRIAESSNELIHNRFTGFLLPDKS